MRFPPPPPPVRAPDGRDRAELGPQRDHGDDAVGDRAHDKASDGWGLGVGDLESAHRQPADRARQPGSDDVCPGETGFAPRSQIRLAILFYRPHLPFEPTVR